MRTLEPTLLLALVAGCGPLVPRPYVAEEPQDAVVARFVTLVNEQRKQEGCRPLTWDPAVARVATSRSRDMVERRYFSHVSPDGLRVFDRLRQAGIAYSAAAENIADGPAGHGVFLQWMHSRGHREAMLSCRYTRHGVGRYGRYWTQILIRPLA